MSAAVTPQLSAYVMLSPEGKTVRITKETFEAIHDFQESKASGRVELEFRDGGFAAVKSLREKRYK